MAAKQEADAPSRPQASADLASKFPPNFLEGVDFIETEEDAKAVEAATLKIQSTFRGKKFGRAKKTPEPEGAAKATKSEAPPAAPKAGAQPEAGAKPPTTSDPKTDASLSKRIGAMQVNDNEPAGAGAKAARRPEANCDAVSSTGASAQLVEDDVERAATKIQAGFKGYKTRKELESKLVPGAAGPGGQTIGGK